MARRFIVALKTSWSELVRELTDTYRPELHYMRGPGPRCRAKALQGKGQ